MNALGNTYIIFLSDNGIAFPGSKTTLYEPGMRLPLLVDGPGLTKPGVINNAHDPGIYRRQRSGLYIARTLLSVGARQGKPAGVG